MDSSVFKRYQNHLKALLLFFDSFCRKNNIKYSLCCGSLLGAVRHKDIIPWDGDIDVALTRTELSKLKKAFLEYDGRFYLEYFETKAIRHSGKKDYGCINARLVDKKCSSSLFCIDIYSIDFLGDDFEHAKKAVKKYPFFYDFAKYSIGFHLPQLRKSNSVVKNILIVLIHLIHPLCFFISWVLKPIFKRTYHSFQSKYLSFNENSKYFTLIPYYLKRFNVATNDFSGYVNLHFGSIEVMAFNNYLSILEKSYGDYTKLPPENKRKPFPSEEELSTILIQEDDELNQLLDAVK